jgi:hypothetical protein
MYIKLNNGVPEIYTIGQLRKDNFNVSFPRKINEEILAEYDVYPVTQADFPDINLKTQKAELNDTPVQVNGAWIYDWVISDKSQSEIEQDNLIAATSVRAIRNKLLIDTDWVITKAVDQNAQDSLGIQVPQVWLDYRQALRDITSHANFPNLQDSDWPTKPEV